MYFGKIGGCINIFDINEIKLVLADKLNEMHKKGIWEIFNENIEFFTLTSEKISFNTHSEWWEVVFDREIIYIILYNNEICGYIRLSKIKTQIKEKNEISIALKKTYQNLGVGSYAYKLFEEEMKEKGIKKIVAFTESRNEVAQTFFEKNNFSKSRIKY